VTTATTLRNGRPRVAITGLGVVAPGGIGVKAFWDLLTSGRTATRAISLFDATGFRSRIAAECDFFPEQEGLSPQEIRRLDRSAQFGLVCVRDAIEDSGVAGLVPPERIGVSIGSAVGCTMRLEDEYVVLSNGGEKWLVDPAYLVPHAYDYMVPSTIAAEAARAAGAEGPVALISTGCTAGLDSIGHGLRLLYENSADVVIAGAADAPLSPITAACFDAIKATSPDNDDPEHASRPFDLNRHGFVLGEGAAVLVLERLDDARARGAKIYGEIVGFASRSNAFHMTGLKPDGREMAEAITAAMAQGGVAPEDIDYINAHGSGTKQNDRHETAAFKRSLGQRAYEVPVSSIKSMIGHSLGAIGSIEVAACALALTHQVVPPTANLHTPDPECDLDYVPLTARDHALDMVLSVGSGFGGFQSAMVVARGDAA
jgi:act minimal PKS ketosynthase (KS/KS alpha)